MLDEPTPPPADVFELFVICTGNRFRSPLVAAYLREATRELPVRVGSAGILELGEVPALEGAVAAADEIGLDLREHRSRYVGNVAVDHADLVLGFERAHVTTAVIDGNSARERTFTLPELVWLLEHSPAVEAADPVSHARDAIAQAHRLRDPSDTLALRQVDDPIGTPARIQQETAREILDLSARLAVGLFGPVVRPSLPPQPRAGRRAWRERLRRRG